MCTSIRSTICFLIVSNVRCVRLFSMFCLLYTLINVFIHRVIKVQCYRHSNAVRNGLGSCTGPLLLLLARLARESHHFYMNLLGTRECGADDVADFVCNQLWIIKEVSYRIEAR